MPPFFIPLYANSVGASASLASYLLAIFNLASAVGRVGFGVLGDSVGPITALVLALTINALSLLTIWPASSSIAPLVAFIVINGVGSGGFFSLIPSVVGSVYGNTRTVNALAMIVSGWAFGYFLVRALTPLRHVQIDWQFPPTYCRAHLSPGGCSKHTGVPVRVAQLSAQPSTMPGHWPWLVRASLLECACYQQRGCLRTPEKGVHGELAGLPFDISISS